MNCDGCGRPLPRKLKTSPKVRGGDWEREVCKKLSLWMSRGLRDNLFWRSAMSGGRATVQHKKGVKNATQGGDISAIDDQGLRLTSQFSIECKYYKEVNIRTMLLAGNHGSLSEFWAQTVRDAVRHGKRPMLVVKQNFYGEYVILDALGCHILNCGNGVAADFQFQEAVLIHWAWFLQWAGRP